MDRPITILAILLLVLFTLAAFIPSGGLAWGFHFLAFLPPVCLAAYVAGGTLLLLSARRLEGPVRAAAVWLDAHPALMLGGAIALFCCAAAALCVAASLPGDSFTLLYNFDDYRTGRAPLAPWHEPLSIHALYWLTSFLGGAGYEEMRRSFLIVHLILGSAFIACAFAAVRLLFDGAVERLLAFGFVLILPYMTFFMDYIEVYSVSTLLLGAYVVASLLVMRGRISFGWLPPLYVLLTLSHFIAGLAVFSLLLLAWRGRHDRYGVAVGFGAALLLVFIVLAMAQFDPDRIIDRSPVSHLLSFGKPADVVEAYSEAYSIFSWYHLLDALNFLILISPFPLLMMVRRRGARRGDPSVQWLAWFLTPVGLFFAVAKLEQGGANDWDVFAAFAFPLALLGAYCWFAVGAGEGRMAAFITALGVTALNSAAWFALNAATEPSIARFESLSDVRNVSQLGQYTMALRLTRYDRAVGNAAAIPEVWRSYSGRFPRDPRGYENAIGGLDTLRPRPDSLIVETYAVWSALDPSNAAVRRKYVEACSDAGFRLIAIGNGREVEGDALISRAISAGYNDLEALRPLARRLLLAGDTALAWEAYDRVAALDSNDRDAYLFLGRFGSASPPDTTHPLHH